MGTVLPSSIGGEIERPNQAFEATRLPRRQPSASTLTLELQMRRRRNGEELPPSHRQAAEAMSALGEIVMHAKSYGSWKCDICGRLFGISFQRYTRAGQQMCGLQIYCRPCKTALFIDGTFEPPEWWGKEYE
jgi:hypothetical protein